MSRISLALIVTAMVFTAGQSSAADTPVVTKIGVPVEFKAPNSKEDGKPRGISGMACLGKPADASRECLVINDEERFGEIATLTTNVLKASGQTIDFVEKGEKGDDVLGKANDPKCRDEAGKVEKGKFNELDGEGVAIAAGFVYVASSHSCSGGGKYKPSSYLLVRFKADSATSFMGASKPIVERSWRLADVLLGSDISNVSGAYGRPKGVGTNIEGIAVIDGRLYAGLRTPTGSSEAYIVSAPVEALFAKGSDPLDAKLVESFKVELGADTGIRDLAATPSGRLLILAGPSVEQAGVEYKLWLLEKRPAGVAKKFLSTVTTSAKGK
ncbi:MAG: DUF3616 domain-containing protein, partial [Bradyrhizobium sp.]